MILAIETSCDDTCAAVVSADGRVRSSIVGRQAIHDLYGGVVPELAARSHLELIGPVIDRALSDAGIGLGAVERIAVTQGPGLVGALLIGLSAAKGLAAGLGIPLRAVDHLDGHVAATWLADPLLEPPFLCLIASGGHTLLVDVVDERGGWSVLGTTLDDAAGEAFDKGARLLGLGYPGGPLIEEAAQGGDPNAFEFTRAPGVEGLDFSFSGLKTNLLYACRSLDEDELAERRADLAASYQAAIADQLADRVAKALVDRRGTRVGLGGGVAANESVRRALAGVGVEPVVPEARYCTDNAAMIGRAALLLDDLDRDVALGLDAYAVSRAQGRSA